MTDVAAEVAPVERAQRAAHPRGLYILFFTEMWERFSYYGMRALLVLYMIEHLGMRPTNSSTVYKWYTSLVYLTPLLGGFIADRYFGLKISIICGGVLMAIGHFLMAFEPLPMFYAALCFLIVGNGFFKPNISTLVGRMYEKDDPRRDGAFTIFYMGINLGAFIAPLVCSRLRVNLGFHYGFAAAGIGMCLGLTVFLLGQRRILSDVAAAGNDAGVDRTKASKAKTIEADPAESQPSADGFAGLIARALPMLMFAFAILVPVRSFYQVSTGEMKLSDAFMMTAFGAISGWMAFTLRSIRGAARDRSIVIFSLFAFSVLFWMGAEQAGNALNVWAEFNTIKHFGPLSYTAEDFQSVNPMLIFALAPLFASLWVWMSRRNLGLSTPAKMCIAMVLMTLSFGTMIASGAAENAVVSRTALDALPANVALEKLDAGRLQYDASSRELVANGVVPTYVETDAFQQAVSETYRTSVSRAIEAGKAATPEQPQTIKLSGLAPGATIAIDAETKSIRGFDSASGTLTVTGTLDASAQRKLLAAGTPPSFRHAIEALHEKSQDARVSGFWLFLFYFITTIGELCLSPVGLAMVTKLAPVRFASLFMGVWLLSSSVAQYVGGTLGESWGIVTPVSYFTIFAATSAVGAVVLLVLVKPLKRLMHGVS